MSGIGLDVLEIERLERGLSRWPRLRERLFTDGELAYADRRGRPARHLAARFCAKEAVAKALGLERYGFRDVEVVASPRGPRVRLSGAAAARAGELGVAPVVSLTHERTVAMAVATLTPADGTERRGGESAA